MLASQKTYTPKGGEITRAWRVVDAEGKSLGRLASEVAGYLRGKHLPGFAEHMDVGDYVIVVNAARVRITGNKLRQKMYYSHSNYPGGFKAIALGDVLAKDPERVIRHAVRGMLPHTTLGRQQLKKMKVYAGAEHPHQAQLAAPQKPYRPKSKTATPEPESPRPEAVLAEREAAVAEAQAMASPAPAVEEMTATPSAEVSNETETTAGAAKTSEEQA